MSFQDNVNPRVPTSQVIDAYSVYAASLVKQILGYLAGLGRLDEIEKVSQLSGLKIDISSISKNIQGNKESLAVQAIDARRIHSTMASIDSNAIRSTLVSLRRVKALRGSHNDFLKKIRAHNASSKVYKLRQGLIYKVEGASIKYFFSREYRAARNLYLSLVSTFDMDFMSFIDSVSNTIELEKNLLADLRTKKQFSDTYIDSKGNLDKAERELAMYNGQDIFKGALFDAFTNLNFLFLFSRCCGFEGQSIVDSALKLKVLTMICSRVISEPSIDIDLFEDLTTFMDTPLPFDSIKVVSFDGTLAKMLDGFVKLSQYTTQSGYMSTGSSDVLAILNSVPAEYSASASGQDVALVAPVQQKASFASMLKRFHLS